MKYLYAWTTVLVLTAGTYLAGTVIEKVRIWFDWGFIRFLLVATVILAVGTAVIPNEYIGLLFILFIAMSYICILGEFEYMAKHRSDSFGKHFKSGLIGFAIIAFFLVYWLYFFLPGGNQLFENWKRTLSYY